MNRFWPVLVVLAVALAGCGNGSSNGATTPTPAVATSTAPAGAPTSGATAAPAITPTRSYLDFLSTLCKGLAASNASTVKGLLPFYQYNSGVRYGRMGDGAGQNGDPSLLSSWLAGAHVRCTSYTPDIAGHGTLLTSGWPSASPGAWSLIEMDTFNGQWKINDFTFGGHAQLTYAMTTTQPIMPYRG